MSEETLKAYRARYPRAMKLIDKREEFLVVKCSEPYAAQVMRLIKAEESVQGKWTEEDEAWACEHVPGWKEGRSMVVEGVKPRNATEKYLVDIIHTLAMDLAWYKYVEAKEPHPYTECIDAAKEELKKHPYNKDDRRIP